MLEIRLIDTTDWGCEYTPEDLAAYEEAIAEAIHAYYPAADVDVSSEHRHVARVIVTTRHEDGRIDTRLKTAREEQAIEETVLQVRRDVWDNGTFWVQS